MVKSTRTDLDLEQISAALDNEDSFAKDVALNKEAVSHLKNWSLIGASLRNELPKTTNLTFADSIAAKIAEEPAPRVVDQVEVNKAPEIKFSFKTLSKKFAFALGQIAVAASVAIVTVVGVQTWNAQDDYTLTQASSAPLGPIEGVNLASYQSSNAESIIRLENDKNPSAEGRPADSDDKVEQKQRAEIDKINNYVRGYVINIASK
ncbi:MAG: hypothetical protein K6F05_00445 [Succinivibrio sp.]|nr:hypothetical protein [Succinivibrio sp.]